MSLVLGRMSAGNVCLGLGPRDDFGLLVMSALGIFRTSRGRNRLRASHLRKSAPDFNQPAISARCSGRGVLHRSCLAVSTF
jgi:hypothetical protein